MRLVVGKPYNFIKQPQRLEYLGEDNGWHQFKLINGHNVWAELLLEDLHMIEETV
jgi:hypothetical protein